MWYFWTILPGNRNWNIVWQKLFKILQNLTKLKWFWWFWARNINIWWKNYQSHTITHVLADVGGGLHGDAGVGSSLKRDLDFLFVFKNMFEENSEIDRLFDNFHMNLSAKPNGLDFFKWIIDYLPVDGEVDDGAILRVAPIAWFEPDQILSSKLEPIIELWMILMVWTKYFWKKMFFFIYICSNLKPGSTCSPKVCMYSDHCFIPLMLAPPMTWLEQIKMGSNILKRNDEILHWNLYK